MCSSLQSLKWPVRVMLCQKRVLVKSVICIQGKDQEMDSVYLVAAFDFRKVT